MQIKKEFKALDDIDTKPTKQMIYQMVKNLSIKRMYSFF